MPPSCLGDPGEPGGVICLPKSDSRGDTCLVKKDPWFGVSASGGTCLLPPAETGGHVEAARIS